MAEVDKEITVKVRAEDDTQKATQSAKARLRDLQKQMLDLEAAGQKNTDQFRRMAAEAGSLKDAIGDTSAQVKALASDTRTLDTFTSAIQGIAGGFAVAQGAAALFGEESEDVQKAMMKVQAALALVNGATAVANALNKDSALMVNLNAAAQRAYALAVGTSTGALKAFRIALVTTGIGAVVVALGFAIEAMIRFTSKTDDQNEAQKDLNKSLFESVNMLDLYERKLKAEGATDEQIAKIRMARFERDLQTSLSFLAVLRVQMKENSTQAQRDLELQYMQEIQLLKVKIAEENRILQDARAARALQAKADFEKRKKENEMEYRAEQITLQEHLDKMLATTRSNEDVKLQKRGTSIKYQLDLQRRMQQEEERLEQMKIDTAAKTFQTLGNLSTLFAGKSERSQRRAFEINKKMSMAQTLIETFSAAQGAYRSQMVIPDPSAPVRATIAAAAAVAAGLLRVQQISKQTFQSPSAVTGGGGGGGSAPPTTGGFASGGGVMNPNSQLTNPNEGAGAGQGQSMRAYVVESDVRTVSGRLRRISEFAQLAN
jgi:hypothetical protein